MVPPTHQTKTLNSIVKLVLASMQQCTSLLFDSLGYGPDTAYMLQLFEYIRFALT